MALRSAAEAAREAGIALLEARSLLPHGQWAGWLKSNFKGTARTAQRYMRVAKNWPTIEEKATSMSHLSVNEALHLLNGRDELAAALVLQAELDAVRDELEFLNSTIDSASVEGLQFIIARTQELFEIVVGLKSTAIKEAGRLACQMEARS
ncbi:DUF3102 domain-containing protein [Mesorhizobium sp. YIM 152430]|uniref:DUF3102 domain-containing protein n=1 Tax=Mesorhizobium sp. YIM 152430 TaxID=3031761 RepID=UPI0023DC61F9|nr:DUF3102 domain-containing protein [Mesorhizobium sp. YIM 152430]MDF1600369.1 DUF3102 domain-containing protein [Mesorhizobium sp. YIM 152430]